MNNLTLKKILIIDDDKVYTNNLNDFFSDKGWLVSLAENGQDAITLLKGMQWTFDCILLDLVMPVMDGKNFIEEIHKLNPYAQIPIIILSGKLDQYKIQELYQDHVIMVLDKGQNIETVEALAYNMYNRMQSKLGMNFEENIISMNSIDEKTHKREDILSSYYDNIIVNLPNSLYNSIDEHLFVIARRWNSWYPSFFDVPGGCYSIISPICEDRQRNRVITIDPGFRFLKVLSELNISVKDIETCIISHNHPDHLGGSFEYIACRHAAKEKSKLICSPNTFSMFTNYNQDGMEVRVLDSRESLVDCKKHKDKKCEIVLDCFDTDHLEIGPKKDSKAIILEFPAYDQIKKVVILGDTSFELSQNRKQYIEQLTHLQTKIVVLHIGSAQLKKRINGHLYLQGLHRLLNAIGEELESQKRSKKDKLIVLISEWGLEHATKQQIEKISPDLTSFDNSTPILDTINIVTKSLIDLQYNERMVIIPADIGLMVGIGSGKIYWKDKGTLKSAEPENIKWKTSDIGLEYYA